MKHTVFVIVLIGILLIVFSLQGCTNMDESVRNMRDKDMTIGCYVTGAGANFNSYFGTTSGVVETCKLKCSKELPPNFSYEYINPRTGCSVKIGNMDNE